VEQGSLVEPPVLHHDLLPNLSDTPQVLERYPNVLVEIVQHPGVPDLV
jgi:hypothetical protein